MSLTPGETYFVSAGEYSGDLLGAELVIALKEFFPKLKPMGVAGPAMLQAGVNPIATTDDLGVMGVFEVARKLASLRMLETNLLCQAELLRPQFAVLIDFAGFHLRLAEQLRMRGIPVFQYVAPKLWAWGGKRAAALRRDYAGILGVLPFEEAFFHQHKVPYTYVGSPHKDRTAKIAINKEALGLPRDRPLVACLPGSRAEELRRILPVMRSVATLVRASVPDALFVVPVAPSLDLDAVLRAMGSGYSSVGPETAQSFDAVNSAFEAGPFRFVKGMSLEVMAASDAAIVASGTATLECGLLGTPMVVLYLMNEFSFMLAKRLVKIANVSLINLIAGERLVKEFIQDIPIDQVAGEVTELLKDSPERRQMVHRFEEIRTGLSGGAAIKAAQVIAETLAKPIQTLAYA